MSIADVIRRRHELTLERARRIQEHESWLAGNEEDLAQTRKDEASAAAGIDVPRLKRGLQVIGIYGRVTEVSAESASSAAPAESVRMRAVERAKLDIALGAQHLEAGYIGVKHDPELVDELCLGRYGETPVHGCIVFSIGLTPKARQRWRREMNLTPEEIEDALYVLVNLALLERTGRPK